jgi:aspartyl-tRNA(Asn)/glutamyl-tRNA(Gln) amidotransferase subunit B
MLAKYSQIPELPDAKRDRFVKEFGLNEYNAGVITSSVEMAHFFEEMLGIEGVSAKTATSLLTVELQGRLKGELNITNSPVNAAKLGLLALRIDDKTISGKAAKEVLDYLMENDKDVDNAIETLGLKQVSDTGAIEAICDAIIAENPEKVAEYKGGKEKLFGFFVGQTMKASQGSADPQTVNEILKAKLG